MTKTIKKIFLLTFVLLNAGLLYSQEVKVPQEIYTGFKKGQSELISQYFNKNIELVIGSKSNIYSKQQAKGILNDFFQKNNVKTFSTIHKGQKGSSLFLIGKLTTSNNVFRIYLLSRESKGKIYIQQIRIDEFDE